MADSWTIISTIAGVIGTVAGVVALFHWDKIAGYFARPQYTQRLIWEDIVDGELHQSGPKPLCPGPHVVPNRPPCKHDRPHASGKKKCWEKNLAVLFNASWVEPSDRRANKPDSLKDSHEYIQTDSKVLLAYLLCTEGLGFGGRLEKTKVSERTLVFHISGVLRFERILTKSEAQCLIEGYPPWYRENFESVYGYTLPHPLLPYNDLMGPDSDGLKRAGWVLALGFQRPLRLNDWGALHESAPFHLAPREWSPPGPAHPPALGQYQPYHSQHPLHTSISRTVTVIEEVLAKAFPLKQSVTIVLDAMKTMDRLGYTGALLDIPHIDMLRWNESRDAGGAGRLERADGIWAMSFFNELTPMRPLTNRDRLKIEPMLDAIMIAAFYGVASVIRYEKLHSRVYHEATELRDIRGRIWLTDCAEEGSIIDDDVDDDDER